MDRSGEPNTGHSATLIITRIFDAPRALVYRMWSDKARLAASFTSRQRARKAASSA